MSDCFIQTAPRFSPNAYEIPLCENRLYEKIRSHVPIVDAAITKIVRLTGGYKVICSDETLQTTLDNFIENVPVGLSSQSLQSFTDSFLDSLITYGNAVGEIIVDPETLRVAGLYNGDVRNLIVAPSDVPFKRSYFVRDEKGKPQPVQKPQLILFSALSPKNGNIYGDSVLKGLPAFSSVLMRIYECIGQNYDRMGNVRYAVTYKPNDPNEMPYAKDRAEQIAREWADGMNASKYGEVRDFVAVGDVDIKVIGSENKLIDTNIPVRQIIEQLISKLSIPPFLLGLNWSTTERMSTQQSDILTSELEYYRRILTPVIKSVCNAFLRLLGSDAEIKVEWDNINLQDEVELADARLKNAQALEIETRLNSQN